MTRRHRLGSAPVRRVRTPTVLAGLVGSALVAASLVTGLSGAATSLTDVALGPGPAPVEPGAPDTSACRSYGATATCQTTNRYLGDDLRLAPGSRTSTTVTVRNIADGSGGSARLVPGGCTTTSTGVVPASLARIGAGLCSSMRIAVYQGSESTGTRLYRGLLSDFTADVPLGRTAADTAQTFTFVVTVPDLAEHAAGLSVSQPVTWTFGV